MSEKEKDLVILYSSILETTDQQTRNMIELYEKKYKFYITLIFNHKNHEPFKLFKKRHDIWKKNLIH